MELEFIRDKVYYKIFDRTYTASSGIYSTHKYTDAAKLAEVQQNIDIIKSDYSAKELVILKQVHGNKVICTDSADYQAQLEADGSVTTKKNLALSVLTADCVPILFASADGNVIGAAHCGWKSAKANLIAEIRKMMENKGAEDIKAVIGPSIQQKSYEVDENYYQDFINDDNACKDLFIPSNNEDRYMFSLSGYVKRKLEQENIKLLLHIDDDTYSMPEKYPSYRRSTHSKETYWQNILSTIIIR
jgi:polyphenol oxidase